MSTVNISVIANGTSYTVAVASPATPKQILQAFMAANPGVVPPSGQRWQVQQAGVALPCNVAVTLTGASQFTLVAVPDNDSLWWILGIAVVVWFLK